MKNKEKYDLKELRVKWQDNGSRKNMEIYADNGVYRMNSNSNAALLKELVNWLEDEYKEPILDKKEKEYLSAVIRPWREKVRSIKKQKYYDCEYIRIYINDKFQEVELPNFEKGTLYKGMEPNREYSLEDLGL